MGVVSYGLSEIWWSLAPSLCDVATAVWAEEYGTVVISSFDMYSCKLIQTPVHGQEHCDSRTELESHTYNWQRVWPTYDCWPLLFCGRQCWVLIRGSSDSGVTVVIQLCAIFSCWYKYLKVNTTECAHDHFTYIGPSHKIHATKLTPQKFIFLLNINYWTTSKGSIAPKLAIWR
jgi:hypothetical protein